MPALIKSDRRLSRNLIDSGNPAERLRGEYGFGRGFAPHNLRHAFATDLIRCLDLSGVQDVSRMLGHKKLETTQIYTRLAPMDLKRCHSRYHPRE
ncbi:MAG: tyrosine-type recombinase/integrase [Chitinivibrionales bacterium]|nr:tyrosine-type recombinase/integrase [Chitinivibrionales bacterium]